MEVAMMEPVDSLIHVGTEMQSCIDSCNRCAQICEECLNLCLQEHNIKDRLMCIRTLQDCAEICTTSACFMARSSVNAKEVSNVCATICEKCASECDMFKDDHCRLCADTCRHCADECRRMNNA